TISSTSVFRLPRAESSTSRWLAAVRSGEEPHRGEAERARGEQLEDHGKPAGGSRDLDPVVGLSLGEPESVPAVDEERGVALAQVDVARVELGEVRDEVDGRLAFTDRKSTRLNSSHQIISYAVFCLKKK